MLKRELKVNFKNFIVWLSILVGIFLVVYLIYPSIISESNIDELNKMMKVFPEDLLKVFNMDISSIDSVFGWIKSEGFVFVLLLTGVYSGILGGNILLKEENDKTIEYLNPLPIKRRDIVLSKMITGVIYISLMVLIFGTFNYIALCISGNFDQKLFISLSLTPLFTSIVIFFITIFLSTFFHKTRRMLGISLGIVFISYFLNMIYSLSNSVSWLKYFSIFTLADIRNVVVSGTIDSNMIILSLVISCGFAIMTFFCYQKKEFV